MDLDRRLVRQIDWLLVAVVLALIAYGLVAVYSATHNLAEAKSDPLIFVKRQGTWVVVGVLAAVVVLGVDYREFQRASRLLYMATLGLLALALVIGPTIGGAERWIVFGPLRLQPGEIAKLSTIIALAHHLSEAEERGTVRSLIVPVALLVPPMVLIMRQPDLGTALVLAGILLGMLYVAGARPLHVVLMIVGGIAAIAGAVIVSLAGIAPLLKEYQIQRLLVFLDPYRYQHGEGWNVIQSMIAIGSGRFFGKGLFGGSQTQLNFLPARHTDFIFSVVGEEFGFLGAVLLLGLYALLIWRLTRIVLLAKDRFGGLLVSGYVAMLGFHLAVNLGMAVGLMPVTGLPLPFISYGGSSLLTNLIAIGLSLNVGVRRQKIRF